MLGYDPPACKGKGASSLAWLGEAHIAALQIPWQLGLAPPGGVLHAGAVTVVLGPTAPGVIQTHQHHFHRSQLAVMLMGLNHTQCCGPTMQADCMVGSVHLVVLLLLMLVLSNPSRDALVEVWKDCGRALRALPDPNCRTSSMMAQLPHEKFIPLTAPLTFTSGMVLAPSPLSLAVWLQVPANLLLVKNTTMHGVFWGSYMMHNYKLLAASMKQVLDWVGQGKLDLQVSHRYTLGGEGGGGLFGRVRRCACELLGV